MTFVTSAIMRNDGQWVLRHVGYANGIPAMGTAKYWRNQGRHWISNMDDATGYHSLEGAGRAMKIAKEYL